MCRILFLKGTDTKKALEFTKAFRQSGTCDNRFGKLVQKLDIKGLSDQHIHGWGYLLVTKNGISNYLTSTFIRDDEAGFLKLEAELKNTDGEFVLFSEIRVTDKGYVSAFNAHPFFFSNTAGFDGFLFHNGFLDGRILAKELGIDVNNYKTKNDSVFIAHSFSENLAQGKSVLESLQVPDEAIKTTYNIMTFVHDNVGKYTAYIYPHIKKSALNSEYVYDCNKLITWEDKDILYIGSSTVADYLHYDFQDVENNKLYEFPAEFIEEYIFEGEKTGLLRVYD